MQKWQQDSQPEGYAIFVQSDDNKVDNCKSLRERAETIIDSKNL